MLVLGMILLVVSMVAVMLCVANEKGDRSYDERQTAVMGKAYKVGFILNSVLLLLAAFVAESWKDAPFDSGFLMVLVLCVDLCAFATYAIWHDAYFGMRRNYLPGVVLLLVLGVIALALGLPGLMSKLAAGARLDFGDGTLLINVCWVLESLVALARVWRLREEGRREAREA
ncbi:hypothetical protein [Olsenella phocaeensis]|uniref:hypothetical protein n=1 Tax=Olsenella phocaeensis TaxID=1852385 RepID=UPI003A8FFABE